MSNEEIRGTKSSTEQAALGIHFSNFARDCGAQLATHDAQLQAVCGNGQQGELAILKAEVKSQGSEIGSLKLHWKYALRVGFGGDTVVAVLRWAVTVLVRR